VNENEATCSSTAPQPAETTAAGLFGSMVCVPVAVPGTTRKIAQSALASPDVGMPSPLLRSSSIVKITLPLARLSCVEPALASQTSGSFASLRMKRSTKAASGGVLST
jgi:hypothetical protein